MLIMCDSGIITIITDAGSIENDNRARCMYRRNFKSFQHSIAIPLKTYVTEDCT